MKRLPFGATGLQVAPLGIGSTHSVEVITLLLDAGVNLVDTAQCYGDHEEFLGRTIRHRRHEFILVSKCGHHEKLADGSRRSRRISGADIDQALQRLRTDHLDVMLLHSYDREPLEQGDAVAVLADAKRAGKIRFAGYSGDNETARSAAGMPDLDVIECSINIADQRNTDVVLPACQARGLGVIAKRPVANSVWRMMDWPADQVSVHHREYLRRWRVLAPLLPTADWSEAALRFNLAVAGLHVSIISTTNVAHAQANLATLAKGPLPAETVAEIRQAFQSVGAEWLAQN